LINYTGNPGDIKVDFNRYKYFSTLPNYVCYYWDGDKSLRTEASLAKTLSFVDDGRGGNKLGYKLSGRLDAIGFGVGSTEGYNALAFWIDITELPLIYPSSDPKQQQITIKPVFVDISDVSSGGTRATKIEIDDSKPFSVIPDGGERKDSMVTNNNNRYLTIRGDFKGWVIIPFTSFQSGTDPNGNPYINLSKRNDLRLDIYFLKTPLGREAVEKMHGSVVYIDDIQFLKSYGDTPVHAPPYTGEYPPLPPQPLPPSESPETAPIPSALVKGGVIADFIVDDHIPDVGGFVTGSLVIDNPTNQNIKNIRYHVRYPYMLYPTHSTEGVIPVLKAREKVEIKLKFKALSGGRDHLMASVTLESGERMNFKKTFSVYGAGWMSGDNHTQSVWSDGRGDIRTNTNVAYSKGHSWLFTTDHDRYLEDKNDSKLPLWQCEAQTNKFKGDFLSLPGVEITTAKNGHSTVWNITESTDWRRTTDAQSWSDYYKELRDKGAIVYVVHAFDPDYAMPYLYDMTYYSGYEVMNVSEHPLSVRGRREFKAWDGLNTRGRPTDGQNGKIFGSWTTDSHDPQKIGDNYIMAFLPRLSAENIYAALTNGNYFGSNGPNIRIDINGVGMGQTVQYLNDGEKLSLNMHIFDDNSYLTKVTLIKNTVTGQNNYEYTYTSQWKPEDPPDPRDTQTTEIVATWDLKGKKLNHWSQTVEITASDKDFYRIEVCSEKAKYGTGGTGEGSGTGFAFSNPIWLEKAEVNNYCKLLAVKYKSKELSRTQAGDFYLVADKNDVFNNNSLAVTALGNPTVVYDKDRDLFKVTVTSPAGNTNEYTIAVIRKESVNIQYSPSQSYSVTRSRAVMVQNFNKVRLEDLNLWAWGTGDMEGKYDNSYLSLVYDKVNGGMLKASLIYEKGELEWGENVFSVPIGPIEPLFDEISFWIDLSNSREVSVIQVMLTSEQEYWLAHGEYYMLSDDEEAILETGHAGKGRMMVPPGFKGFITIPVSSFSEEEFPLDLSRSNLSLAVSFHEPKTGTFALFDNLQKRQRGAMLLRGDQLDSDALYPPDDNRKNPPTGSSAPFHALLARRV
jgi:hypothetical protein